jgi:hypothetical protein
MACAGAAAMLAGCMGGNPFGTAQVDPGSPVAAEVASVAKAGGEFPSFRDIPPIPGDLRPLREWGREAEKLEAAAAQLERETAANTWTLTGTQAFAGRAQRDAGPALEVDNSARGATEAFARQIRERATPPPLPR